MGSASSTLVYYVWLLVLLYWRRAANCDAQSSREELKADVEELKKKISGAVEES